MDLKPLACAKCGGPVPLGEADRVPCPYCDAEVEIPAEHRALRRAAKKRADAEAALGEIYARVGKPPGLVLRAWGSAVGGAVIALGKAATVFLWIWWKILEFTFEAAKSADDIKWVLLVLAIPFAAAFGLLGGVAWCVRAAGGRLGVDLIDVWSVPYAFLAVAAGVYVLAAAPLALFRYGESFARVRQRIQASLAAAPPRTPGGPALCRQCGAALTVGVGELGVRCAYCRSDNLVALPARWVRRVRDKAKTFYKDARAADSEEKRTRAEAWQKARAIAIGGLALPVIMPGCGVVMQSATMIQNRTGWAEAVAKPRALGGHACGLFDNCSSAAMPGVFDIAARRGERLVLACKKCEQARDVKLRRMSGAVVAADWRIHEDGREARVRMPVSGWLVAEGIKDKDDWSVTVER
jgi:hypothetical protein